MSVPYLRPLGFGSGTGHLTVQEQGAGADLQTSLVASPVCNPAGHDGVSATYRVRSVSRNVSFLVQQTYRFDVFDPSTKCEPSLTAQCVRFWPTVTWGLEGAEKRGGWPREPGDRSRRRTTLRV
jgi:hypothetical protein